MTRVDVAVVGSGPNGLAAAVTMARAGLTVEVHEQAAVIGGGLRGEALFDSAVRHDLCAAVHPMAAASAFFRAFDLEARGVRLLQPPISYAHPLDGGAAAFAYRDLAATRDRLGADGRRWYRLMAPLVRHSPGVTDFLLSGQRSLPPDPAAPLLLGPRVVDHLLRGNGLRTEAARALLTGVAAHAVGRLPSLPAGAIALLLGHLAHATGWPLPQGGSHRIAEALADDLTAHGGAVHTGRQVTDLAELDARVIMLDTTPRGLLTLAGDRLPARYRRALERFRYGPGAAKADFLVSEPIPWADPEVGRAGTVHLGGTRAEMFATEYAAVRGKAGQEPFVLLVDPAVTDPGRAVGGRRPVWAYAHVPNGDTRDPVPLITRRIERYAPGFADTVIAARGVPAAEYETYNPNYPGGDIGAGAITLTQSVFRPTPAWNPYRTPLPGVYLCSASTPPGPSVHGMCGHLAAMAALRREFHIVAVPHLGPNGGPTPTENNPPPHRGKQESVMSVSHRPTAAEDFAGYLRAYHADAIDGSDPVAEVWDRYHLPDGTHQVNGRMWDRDKILGSLRSRRSLGASYELYIHEVTVEGRRAAARYTISTPMLGKIQSATEAAVFAELAQDGRVARTISFSATRPGWSGRDRDEPFDSAARPAPGTSPAPPPAEGEEPTPAQDPAHYLRAYYAAGYDVAVPAAEAHDRFHTPDALHQVGRKVMQRSGVLKALEEGRKLGHTYPVEVHETLREGNRFAARYTTSRDGNPKRPQEVFAFGEFAPDGRVQSVRFALDPGYDAA